MFILRTKQNLRREYIRDMPISERSIGQNQKGFRHAPNKELTPW
jgi:hypothetical protein